MREAEGCRLTMAAGGGEVVGERPRDTVDLSIWPSRCPQHPAGDTVSRTWLLDPNESGDDLAIKDELVVVADLLVSQRQSHQGL